MIENEISVLGKFTMRINFNLKSIGGKRSQIWLKTTIKGQRVNIYTKMLIEPGYWIRTTRTQIGEKARTDSTLGNVQNRINKDINKNLQKIINYCREYSSLVSEEDLEGNVKLEHNATNFKNFIESRIKGEVASFERNPLAFFQDYIERKQRMTNRQTMRTISKGTIYNHKNALRRLLLFCEETHRNLVWELFNNRFEEEFTNWMIENKNYSANTIPQQFSIMKVWLKEAEKEKYIHDESFHHFLTKGQDVDTIALTEEEIKRLFDIDFSSEEIKSEYKNAENIEITRDLFVLACFTGLRFGDYQDMSDVQIEKENLRIYTQKTSSVIVAPILPMVKNILEKYNNKLPHCVSESTSIKHIRICAKIARIDSPTTITAIKGGKAVHRTAPRYEFIMNHTARRSFATNAYRRGAPAISIMKITGHKTLENFLKYIKVSKSEHADIVRRAFENT